MARLQILQLPEGAGDRRPPFALVVDQVRPEHRILGAGGATWRDYWHNVAHEIGARGVIVTEEDIELPGNDLSSYASPLRQVEGDVDAVDAVPDQHP